MRPDARRAFRCKKIVRLHAGMVLINPSTVDGALVNSRSIAPGILEGGWKELPLVNVIQNHQLSERVADLQSS